MKDELEEVEEIEEEATVVEEETEVAAPDEPAQAAPAPAPAAAPSPLANPLASDPYEFERCTISVQIVLLPADGNEHGREVMVGVRNHQDPPIIRVFREDEVPLGSPITDLLDELRGEFAARAMANAVRAADEAAKAQQAKSKTVVAKAPAAAPKPAAEAKPEPAKKVIQPAKKVGKEPNKDQLSLFG